jgi:hypothetical protein
MLLYPTPIAAEESGTEQDHLKLVVAAQGQLAAALARGRRLYFLQVLHLTYSLAQLVVLGQEYHLKYLTAVLEAVEYPQCSQSSVKSQELEEAEVSQGRLEMDL